MDAWGTQAAAADIADHTRLEQHFADAGHQTEKKPKPGKDPGENNPRENISRNTNVEPMASGCLVVSGALDRTLCIFRADFGEGLSLLRRLNLACSPEGLPGALLTGFPAEGGGSGMGDMLEVGR